MSDFRAVAPQELSGNYFGRIGKEWMLVGAKQGERVNMMTASWGGIGIYWNKPVAICYIRPTRFTKSFVDEANTFSLTFFDESYREQLHLCGKESGRDMDKVVACGFQVLEEEGIPYFAQANTALLCKTIFHAPLLPENFVDPGLDAAAYPLKDYHTLYVAEIVKALVK